MGASCSVLDRLKCSKKTTKGADHADTASPGARWRGRSGHAWILQDFFSISMCISEGKAGKERKNLVELPDFITPCAAELKSRHRADLSNVEISNIFQKSFKNPSKIVPNQGLQGLRAALEHFFVTGGLPDASWWPPGGPSGASQGSWGLWETSWGVQEGPKRLFESSHV